MRHYDSKSAPPQAGLALIVHSWQPLRQRRNKCNLCRYDDLPPDIAHLSGPLAAVMAWLWAKFNEPARGQGGDPWPRT